MKLRIFAIVALMSLLSLVAGACAETALPTLPTSEDGTAPISVDGNFRFLISDEVNAIDDFESVIVTISTIGVQSGGESGSWIEFTPDITEVDLKPLVGENALEIWSGNLTEGEYSKVFIYVTEINGTLIPELGGEKTNVKLPSEKLHISKPFTISDNETTSFVYDVTVVKAGQSGMYVLKPQIAQSGADQEFKEVKPEDKGKPDDAGKPEDKGKPEEQETEKPEADKEDEVILEDTAWVLKEYSDSDNLTGVIDDTEITIEFVSEEGRINGSAGCNKYFASYEVDESQLSIPGPIASTKKYCGEPEGTMDQEQEYLAVLQLAESYEINGKILRINCGEQVLVFELE